MNQSQTQCPVHGREGIGLVCEHIAFAVERGERVGFFWGDDSDTARSDAWCLGCEQRSVPSMARHPSNGSGMLTSRFFVPSAGTRPNESAVDLPNNGTACVSSEWPRKGAQVIG
jgi:hypothetical protein